MLLLLTLFCVPAAAAAALPAASVSAGQLRIIPDPELREHLAHIDSTQEIDKMANDFVEGIRGGSHREQGWPNSMYGKSACLPLLFLPSFLLNNVPKELIGFLWRALYVLKAVQ